MLCPACLAEVSGDPCPRPPTAPPRGLPGCWAGASYEGATRRAILAYKERGRTALARPLATCLAITLTTALGTLTTALGVGEFGRPFVLVPVPSSRRAVRLRGHDPVGRLAVLAARRLRSLGWPVTSAPVLAQRRRVLDQAGLSAPQRAANLAGAFGVRRLAGAGGRALWGRPRPIAVLVDDIVTTGATLAEAAEALNRAGVPVPLAVTLAATRHHQR